MHWRSDDSPTPLTVGEQPVEWLKTANRAARTKRWHTEEMLHHESVAEHSFGVVLAILAITNGEAAAGLLKAGLMHDLAERWTGDIPGPALWASAALNAAEKDLASRVENHFGLAPEYLSETELRVLKQADKIDLLNFCMRELRLGNANAARPFVKVVDYMATAELALCYANTTSAADRIVNAIVEDLFQEFWEHLGNRAHPCPELRTEIGKVQYQILHRRERYGDRKENVL